MRSLPIPTDSAGAPLVPEAVFDTCISKVRNKGLKRRLSAIRATIAEQSLEYSTKGTAGLLHDFPPHDSIGALTTGEMTAVYTSRMVPEKSPGRQIYQGIMQAAPNRRCPLCGVGTVNTLDHYLPKSEYPTFVITPCNLVPACEWCQGEKMAYVPHGNASVLHPYFDNFDGEIWLAAEVAETTPVAFRFFSSPPPQWQPPIPARLNAHLKEHNLYALFTSNAGSRLVEIRERLVGLSGKGGPQSVRDYLLEELRSFEHDRLNSWLTAMYRAAASSQWFCDGGFAST